MNNKIDGGPIYLKKNLTLDGSAYEIFQRATKIVFSMIKEINNTKIVPKPQSISQISFKRLTRKDNQLDFNKIKNLNEIYDRIRMVDAPGYPCAFEDYKNFVINFYNAKKIRKTLYASVKINIKKK